MGEGASPSLTPALSHRLGEGARRLSTRLSNMAKIVWTIRLGGVLLAALIGRGRAAETNTAAWLQQPLSIANCIDLALRQNSTILKGKSDLEAAYGVVVQTR